LLFTTSKRSRRKWIRSLTSEGELSETEAAQVAWATFPFDDRVRPRSRDFEKAVRSHSRTYLKSTKGIGSLEAAHEAAMETLLEMAGLANQYREPHYAPLYMEIVSGAVPDE
jgi:hypothetical protein